jgi:hypothetical protein
LLRSSATYKASGPVALENIPPVARSKQSVGLSVWLLVGNAHVIQAAAHRTVAVTTSQDYSAGITLFKMHQIRAILASVATATTRILLAWIARVNVE